MNRNINRFALFIATFFICSPFAVSNVYKVVDAHGNTVIPPLYSDIHFNDDGTFKLFEADVQQSTPREQSVIADLNGKVIAHVKDGEENKYKVIVPPGCTSAVERDDYLQVNSPNGVGIFSRSGHQIVPPKYLDVRSAGDQMFVAKKSDGDFNWLLLDGSGHVICELPKWARPDGRRFHDGLLNVSDVLSPPMFVDKLGKPKSIGGGAYREIGDFKDGLAVASYREADVWCSGYLNTNGEMVLGPYKNCTCSQFSKGVAPIYQLGSTGTALAAGLLDRSGKIIVPIGAYDSIREIADGKWLASNKSGCFLLQHDGSILCAFPKNCKSISAPSKLTEAIFIPCEFEKAITEDQPPQVVWGYCDITGKIRIKPNFFSCMEFIGELAPASIRSTTGQVLFGVINRNGDWVLQPRFNSVQIVSPERFIVSAEPKEAHGLQFGNGSWSDRRKIFGLFLREHNLIGMSEAELAETLGAPNRSTDPSDGFDIWYSLTPNALCGNASSSLEFRLDRNKKVSAWRQADFMAPRGRYFITEDVVPRQADGPFTLDNLEPKKCR